MREASPMVREVKHVKGSKSSIEESQNIAMCEWKSNAEGNKSQGEVSKINL